MNHRGPIAAPKPPAGHRVLLRERVEDDATLVHARQGGERVAAALRSARRSRLRRTARTVCAGGTSSARPSSSRGVHSAPVGLCRSFRMSSFVAGVTSRSIARGRARSRRAPRRRCRARTTAEELDQRAVDGKARLGYNTSSRVHHRQQENLPMTGCPRRLDAHVVGTVAQTVRERSRRPRSPREAGDAGRSDSTSSCRRAWP